MCKGPPLHLPHRRELLRIVQDDTMLHSKPLDHDGGDAKKGTKSSHHAGDDTVNARLLLLLLSPVWTPRTLGIPSSPCASNVPSPCCLSSFCGFW